MCVSHSLVVHFLWVGRCGLCLCALSELRSLSQLRVHLQRVDLLCRLLNKAGKAGNTKKKQNKTKILLHNNLSLLKWHLRFFKSNETVRQTSKGSYEKFPCVMVGKWQMPPAPTPLNNVNLKAGCDPAVKREVGSLEAQLGLSLSAYTSFSTHCE